MKKKTQRISTQQETASQPRMKKGTLKDLDPAAAGHKVKGGGTHCGRSR